MPHESLPAATHRAPSSPRSQAAPPLTIHVRAARSRTARSRAVEGEGARSGTAVCNANIYDKTDIYDTESLPATRQEPSSTKGQATQTLRHNAPQGLAAQGWGRAGGWGRPAAENVDRWMERGRIWKQTVLKPWRDATPGCDCLVPRPRQEHTFSHGVR